MRGINLRDFIGGLLVAAVGLYFLVEALDMRLGTAMSMGPGYFPMLAGGFVTAIGLLIAFLALASAGTPEKIEWRPMVAILGGIAAFGFIFSQFGMVPAMFAGIVLCSLGDPTSRLIQTAVLAGFGAIAAWLLFSVGLNLPMPGLRFPSLGF